MTRTVSPLPVGLFRILFCAVVMAEIAQLIALRHLLFDAVPYRQPGPVPVAPLLWLWMIAVAAVAVGWRTRPAALVSYALAVFFLGFRVMMGGFDYHHDVMVIPALGLFALLPAGRALSIDSLLARARSAHREGVYQEAAASVTAWILVLPLLVVATIYLDSLIGKFTSSMWTSGLGLWAPASFPFATWWDVTPFLEHRLLMLVSGYVAFGYEVTFVIAVLFRRLRLVYAFIGLVLHLGIAVMYPIPLFGLGAAAYLLLLFPAAWYARAGHAAKAFVRRFGVTELSYDEGCDDCRRWSAVVVTLDFLGAVRGAPRRSDRPCDHALVVRRQGGRALEVKGEAAVRAVLVALRWPFPALVLWALPGGWRRALLAYSRSSLTREEKPRRRLVAPAHPTAAGAKLRNRAIAIAMVLWIAAVAFVGLRRSAVADSAFYTTLRQPMRLLYPFTGIRDHGVFVDRHFLGYDREYSLWEVRDGTLHALPFITEAGEAGPLLRGRVWVLWHWRVFSPRVLPAQRAAGLRRFAYFWVGRTRGADGSGEVVLRERSLEVSLDAWKPGLPRRNREAPWRDVARVTVR